MINFQQLDGPFSIPVFHQSLPEIVTQVCLHINVFSGSADDTALGQPGLHHWFEHVPGRGTVKYPRGSADMDSFVARHGGKLNAFTNPLQTAYWVYLPARLWREGLAMVVDLVAQPLLRAEDVEAERTVIHTEMKKRLSNPLGYGGYHISRWLWHDHVLAHPTIGYQYSLDNMTVDILRQAHPQSYSRSRCSLFTAGRIPVDEMLTTFEEYAQDIPDNPITERRTPPRYADFPAWQSSQTDTHETGFSSSAVFHLFEVPAYNIGQWYEWCLLRRLLTTGSLHSPLLRLLREERKLVYDAQISENMYAGGGFWGFFGETGLDGIDALKQGCKDVLHDDQLRSRDWYQYVLDATQAEFEMMVVNPLLYVRHADERFYDTGQLISNKQFLDGLRSVTYKQAISCLDRLDSGHVSTFILRGTDKT